MMIMNLTGSTPAIITLVTRGSRNILSYLDDTRYAPIKTKDTLVFYVKTQITFTSHNYPAVYSACTVYVPYVDYQTEPTSRSIYVCKRKPPWRQPGIERHAVSFFIPK